MKNYLLLSLLGVTLLSVPFFSSSCGAGKATKGPDTLKINTTYLGADVIGFNGPTPVEISVSNGVITGIKALPNRETPRFFQLVLDSGLLQKMNGKTVEEAKTMRLDAVSGATFTSNAIIKNIQLGLEDGGKTPFRAPRDANPISEMQ